MDLIGSTLRSSDPSSFSLFRLSLLLHAYFLKLLVQVSPSSPAHRDWFYFAVAYGFGRISRSRVRSSFSSRFLLLRLLLRSGHRGREPPRTGRRRPAAEPRHRARDPLSSQSISASSRLEPYLRRVCRLCFFGARHARCFLYPFGVM